MTLATAPWHAIEMRWSSTVGTDTSFPRSVDAACEALERELESSPDLVLMFISAEFRSYWRAAPKILARRWPGAMVVGATGVGVIGGLVEAEGTPAIALAGASFEGLGVASFQIDVVADGERAEPHFTGALPAEPQAVLLLSNPFYADGEDLINVMCDAVPGAQIFGGLASGGERAEELGLFYAGEFADVAAVGLVFGSATRIQTVVAPGCRPIGEPYIVTQRQGNLILSFDRGRPLDALRDLHESLTPRDRALFTVSLSVGVDISQGVEARAGGDFLIRNVTGVSDTDGGIYIGATLDDYQVVQFHVRDAVTAAEDLRRRLVQVASAPGEPTFGGALLFTCLGRGQALYGRSGHDSDMIREVLGDLPLAGLFCHGEIGPIEGRAFLHGYTSVLVLFDGEA